jgi:hypothetical protein
MNREAFMTVRRESILHWLSASSGFQNKINIPGQVVDSAFTLRQMGIFYSLM